MRTNLVVSVVVTVAMAGSGAYAQGGPDAGVPGPELDRARAAAAALSADLRARLMKELAAGGPVEAVRVCSEVAPAIAKEQSQDGLSVRRVSERWRNPAGTPDAWETEQLRRLASAHAKGELPAEEFQVVGGPGGRVLRYLKPILIGGPCLSCHGDPEAMKPEVVSSIRERYPEDKATGYHDGDLRGAVSVTVVLR